MKTAKLKEVIISITNRCSLKCRMCDIPDNKTKELTTSQWKNIIQEASLTGARTIVFSGGEPLLREDIFELISFVKNSGMNACLTSNGVLLDEKAACELYQAGVDVVNISLEGPEEIHDYLRGEGTYKKAVSALDNLRKYKVESTIAAMVSRYNYRHLAYIMESAKKYGAGTVRFQPFSSIFIGDKSKEKDFFIDKKYIKEAREALGKAIKLGDKYNISTNPVGYLKMIPYYLSGRKAAPRNKCAALWDSCPINAGGDVFPCWVITEEDKRIGNAGREGFSGLWNSERHIRIKERIFKEGCRGCMMSCYDGVFNSAGQRLRKKITKLKLRLNFYKAYRGTLKSIFNRIFKNVKRRVLVKNTAEKGKNAQVFEEINFLKKKLRKEIAKLK